ncbi:helix-turn-helix domain-containing protein [Nonomuraea ferruginea]|uniref:Helix-turn-helix transcriptional regulator n=1 Tax=Nonomuraea ferruginea TaxID=46174 RepID=A0ABT4SZV7_9ACTN|nr:helix-turn-helix transcriptional regulator [Nonomuraea ferruginea]MDA0642796.1 helix-turn-helix transcriptional regulator [Nonomuraea ferruginea]
MSIAEKRSDPDQTNQSGTRSLSEENVALRIAWEMRRRGWSQERMAQELTHAGCPTHQSAISKIVNPKPDGSRRAISVDEAIALARVFGIALEELPLPMDDAEGRDLHDLSRTVTHEGRNATEQYAHFLLAWARLRHRLAQEQSRAAYEGFLAQRRVEADTAEQAIAFWRDTDSWRAATAGYETLHRILQAMGDGRDLTPPAGEARRRHSVVADLVRLRELFATKIPSTPVRVVPDLIYHATEALIRAGIQETAIGVIDAYDRGTAHPTDSVVEEIDRRLRQISDQEPEDRQDYLESLAARTTLNHRGRQPRQPPEELAAELGVSIEEYQEARKIAYVHRETGMR